MSTNYYQQVLREVRYPGDSHSDQNSVKAQGPGVGGCPQRMAPSLQVGKEEIFKSLPRTSPTEASKESLQRCPGSRQKSDIREQTES